MRLARTTLALLGVAVIAGCAGMAIDDRAFGLHKASVFDDVEPTPFGFDSTAAGRMTPPSAGSGIPPMISHAIDDSLPITAARNDCLDCHDKPQNIGKPVAAGKARPTPASHYQGLANLATPRHPRRRVATAESRRLALGQTRCANRARGV